ncbi:MAG: hypothetical protein SAMD01599839_21340 [Rectinema sp.]
MLLESRIRELVNFAFLSTSDWQLTLCPVRLREFFTRTLENLFSNSLKFTRDGGRIELDCYTLEGFTDIAFSDDGPGIADADKPYIFEAFYRGDKTRTTQGMGLGLAIAKSITEAHGFSISVRDTQGPGTVIVIRIPHCQG